MTALVALMCSWVALPSACARARQVGPALYAQHDVDPRLLAAVALVESGWRQSAVSTRGAIGVMQVLPSTAARRCPGMDLRDLRQNVACGARILARAIRRTGSVEAGLTAYSGGEHGYAKRVMEVLR
jgi:soluble lytic murein transglycosylase-like protein